MASGSKSNLNDQDEIKIKKNNFFNLSSSEDDDEDDDSNNQQIQTKIRKWDWDKEENRELYYYKDNDSNNKRLKSTNDDCSIVTSESTDRFRIEKTTNDSNSKYSLLGHNSSVNRIQWCRKFKHTNLLLASSMDNKISIWNINEPKRPVRVLDEIHSKSIRNAIWSQQETEIISVSFDQTSALLNAETGKEINRLKHTSVLTAVVNHPNDEQMILIGATNEILAWDLRTNKICKSYKYKSSIGQLQDLLFINENEFVSCGDVVCKESAENAIIVWDFKSTAAISNQIFHEKFISTCLKKHPSHPLFLAQTHGNYIAEFSSKSPFKMNKFKRFESNGHFTAGYSIGFDLNKNGTILGSGSSNGCVFLYNFQTSKLIKKMEAFNRYITHPCMDVKFQPHSLDNKEVIAVSCWNGMIKILQV